MPKTKLIAFYLPQFYPTKENDEWWQPGFTEWTNVAKAKPLFRGHVQPKIPRDLGFYDLRVSETREKQAELAKKYGIDAFCYWHYWHAGRRLLDLPFSEVIKSGKPDFPFCLCWANHSWYKKTWNPDIKNREDILLIEQTYPGIQDYIDHFEAMLPAFKDSRYLRDDDGKLLFGLYSYKGLKNPKLFFDTWNDLAAREGLNGFNFFAYCMPNYNEEDATNRCLNLGYNSVTQDYYQMGSPIRNKFDYYRYGVMRRFLRRPTNRDYDKYIKEFKSLFVPADNNYPCVIPNYDHSPRSAQYGIIYPNATPEKFKILLDWSIKTVSQYEKNRFVFIKSWNEWGEGNYLEPDVVYGMKWLEAVRNAKEDI